MSEQIGTKGWRVRANSGKFPIPWADLQSSKGLDSATGMVGKYGIKSSNFDYNKLLSKGGML